MPSRSVHVVAKGRVPSLSPRNRISGRARAPRGGSGPTGARPAAECEPWARGWAARCGARAGACATATEARRSRPLSAPDRPSGRLPLSLSASWARRPPPAPKPVQPAAPGRPQPWRRRTGGLAGQSGSVTEASAHKSVSLSTPPLRKQLPRQRPQL